MNYFGRNLGKLKIRGSTLETSLRNGRNPSKRIPAFDKMIHIGVPKQYA